MHPNYLNRAEVFPVFHIPYKMLFFYFSKMKDIYMNIEPIHFAIERFLFCTYSFVYLISENNIMLSNVIDANSKPLCSFFHSRYLQRL